ncbi:uncharacterized protein BHQ10_009315 [Talaromyces amestolkiae]|uniref:Cytochrome P450 n=1 Tax=Talaromyces amestolkiae TaxID=1196081 RepID=A0A364LC09_TALAM|nr:uncharacterized protein BHQ10_009315 [Talaromyces amestolkiae]RAO73303.1 hypothetical protein BHQ10_009315 [Talaromyces amestolkiae]
MERTLGLIEAPNYLFLIFIFVPVLIFGGYRAFHDKRRKHLPPQVPGWPIINNTLQHRVDNAPPLLQKWAREHGEIFRTRAGATDFIWLNSMSSVKELYDKRSAIYSSRQPMPMACDTASQGKRMVYLPYGKDWRKSRTIFHKVLTEKMAEDYSVIQKFEAKQLSVDLLDNPKDFYMHNRRYTASVIFQITYGWRIEKWNNEDVKKMHEVLARFIAVRRPGAFLVDNFPVLAKNPIFNLLSNWKSIGRQYHNLDNAIFMDFWNRMKKSVDDGTAPHSFAKTLLNSYEKNGLTENEAAWICGGLLEAGSETTGATLNNCIMMLLSNRDAIRQAHEEIDRIVGKGRLPTYQDEPNLPFIRGIIKETLRMRPIGKFGNNHYLTKDDWYNGYFIPKGSTVMANWWAIHYDPEVYPEPEKFLPERWKHYPYGAAAAAVLPDGNKRDHISYGGGRRICAGIHLAEKSLFINVARLLWGFDIDFAKDANGDVIPLDFTTAGFLQGSGSIPKPYQCSILPRSKRHGELMRQEWREAQDKGIDFSHIKWNIGDE